MRLARRTGAIGPCLFLAIFLHSCAPRIRPIARGSHPATQKLLTATKAELEARVAEFYNAVQSFTATCDLTPSLGSVYKGKITDYQDVTAYIDFRKPASIRVVGLLPVVHTTAFNMVSDGREFKVLLPLKNRFIEGATDAPRTSSNKLENIRPETFLSAMLVRPVDRGMEKTMLVDDTTETNAFYHLVLVGTDNDEIYARRRVTFDRVNLQIVEQREYDRVGSIVSVSRYGNWQIYDNIRFPSQIEMTRPQDEYGLVLVVTKMEINRPVADTKFTLAKPENAELTVIGASGSKPAEPAAKGPK